MVSQNRTSLNMNHEKRHAVSLAVQWIRKGLEMLRGVLADDGLLTAEMLEKNYRQQALDQIVACRFKTNDLVTLVYGRRSGWVQINATSIDLDTREFLVLKALAVSQRLLPRRAFVPMETILAHIEETRLADRWREPSVEDVRRVVLSIRNKIRSAEGNQYLIEAKRGEGYRISSPSVDVECFAPPPKVAA